MTTLETPPNDSPWHLKSPIDARAVFIVIVAFVLLSFSAQRVDLGKMAEQMGEFGLASVGLKDSSQIGRGLGGLVSDMFPVAIAERTPITMIEHFDANRLPPFSRIETVQVEESKLDSDTFQTVTHMVEKTYLVQPAGYLVFVLGKMLETIEIAIWASLFAIIGSLPLAIAGARNFTPHPLIYFAARSTVSFLRSMPELISALFLVLAFGFGPVAGILALALHSMGFLAKFYAEDIEAADPKPLEAMRATGAGSFAALRLAVLPQVLPSYTALTLYILDRNVRMAAVIGLVGAGGIGQELKGRYDMFQYDRVGTILLVIFITVLLLDQLAAHLRRRLI
ncbi:MAG: phosphonate ABC transporter, permease protein PhnE [Hyphomonas sp.]